MLPTSLTRLNTYNVYNLILGWAPLFKLGKRCKKGLSAHKRSKAPTYVVGTLHVDSCSSLQEGGAAVTFPISCNGGCTVYCYASSVAQNHCAWCWPNEGCSSISAALGHCCCCCCERCACSFCYDPHAHRNQWAHWNDNVSCTQDHAYVPEIIIVCRLQEANHVFWQINLIILPFKANNSVQTAGQGTQKGPSPFNELPTDSWNHNLTQQSWHLGVEQLITLHCTDLREGHEASVTLSRIYKI